MAGVKAAYQTKELTALLGVAAKNVLARAKREGWLSRPRAGRGGGNEWLLESMPEGTRQSIALAVAGEIAQSGMPSGTPAGPGLSPCSPAPFTVNTLAQVPEKKRQRAAARALLVSMAREFGAASGAARSAAYEVFCYEYNRGVVDVPAWVRGFVPNTCRSSLDNWEQAMGREGLAALAGRQGRHRKGKGVIDATPGMADMVIAHIIKYREVSADYVMRALKAAFQRQVLPNLRSLQRWMKQYRADNESTILKIQNPDAWKSKYQSAAGSRSAGITGVNRLWELDSSPADILLADGKRYTVIGCLDVGPRRARLELAETSNSLAVCSLLRRSILDFGIAEAAKMDNGADYASFQVTTVLHDLGIRPEWCTPFSPEEKPHILLIGEETLPTRLRQFERFHGRVLKFTLAEPASLEDAKALRDLWVEDVDIADDLLAKVHRESKGSVRRICVNLENIRELGSFTKVDLALKTRLSSRDSAISEYVQGLERAGFLRVISGKRPGVLNRYELALDVGVEAPRVSKAGAVLPPSGRSRMWKTMRILGTFTTRELAGAASLDGAPVALTEAEYYCKWLVRGGYLRCAGKRWAFVAAMNSGPKAPQILRVRKLYDPSRDAVICEGAAHGGDEL